MKKMEAIEKLVGSPINIIVFEKDDYQSTLDFSTEAPKDLKAIMKEISDFETFQKARKKKKK